MMIKVKIEQTDINKGIRNDCNHCPFVLATIRALFEAGIKLSEIVSTDGIDLIIGGNHWELPNEVIAWIMNFDGEEEVLPGIEFTFELDKPYYRSNDNENSNSHYMRT